jgi:hypothetical protein
VGNPYRQRRCGFRRGMEWGFAVIYDTRTMESIRPLSNDERMAAWACKYFAAGYHHTPPCNDDDQTPPPDMAA